MQPQKRLLVTGVSGFLGWNLCAIAAESYKTFGTCFRHVVSPDECEVIQIDLTSHDRVVEMLDLIKPHIIVHTAALSQPNYCQDHPAESELINVSVPTHLAQLCAEKKIRFVFTSTDLVFDGTAAPYKESDPVCPLSLYGEQKVRAERNILASNPDASVCRMPLMYGDPSPVSGSFIQPLISKLKNGVNLNLFTDEFRTPVSARDAGTGLLLAARKHSGILHLGGPQRLSRFDMGIKIAKSMGFSTDLIKPIRQEDIPMPAPRPKDVSLNSCTAQGLGWKAGPMTQSLEKLRRC